MNLTYEEACRRLGVPPNGNSAMARCPAHDDKRPSLSLTKGEDGTAIVNCFVGCDWREIETRLGIASGGALTPARNTATLQRLPKKPKNQGPLSVAHETMGCTLAQYAEAKQLPIEFLKNLGLRDMPYQGTPAVRIPYLVSGGATASVRFRIALDAKDRFRWRTGDKPQAYGLWRLDTKATVTLVEGESDCHTLWYHGINAVGIPGANNWREDRDAPYLADCERIYVVIEPDQGGKAVLDWIEASSIRDRVWLVDLGEHKDTSNLHVDDPDRFNERWAEALTKAEKWSDRQTALRTLEAGEAFVRCADLAKSPSILDRFAVDLRSLGLIGEESNAKLLFLALASRFFKQPISVAVKGPSSGGKSFLVETVLNFFPNSAFYALTAMSEHALAYSNEPLRHRFLIIYEASGMESDLQSYLIRTLLSEGRIRYETVEKTAEGMQPRLIEREGPTGLLVTTTAVRLHPENETRLLSLTVTDTSKQTRGILRAIAEGAVNGDIDCDSQPDNEWHDLQMVLAAGEHGVVIPYATTLVELLPPVAVRLRRDVTQIFNLIRAHALLHQYTRTRDQNGQIVANDEDYRAIYDLVAPIIADGVEQTVSDSVRQTVDVVEELQNEGMAEISNAVLAKKLNLDKGATSRRVRQAKHRGFIKNLEDKKGKPARLVIGDPMPEDLDVLPKPETLEEVLHCCSVVGGDRDHPLPPHDQWADMDDQDWEERAAILEYDGGLERNEAEQQARRMALNTQ
jgi:hypothetical protein